jgi:hypothetical protein
MHRVEVIPYGLDCEVFCPGDKAAAREPFGLPHDAIVVTFGAHSNAEKRKRTADIMQAVKAVFAGISADTERKIVFACFGARGEVASELGVPVFSFGKVETEEAMARVYRASDIFVTMPAEDNLPNTVLEALACGVPVFATATGGIPDMVREGFNGALVEVGDWSGMAEKLVRQFSSPAQIQQMGAQAREAVIERYTLEHQARRYVSLFEELKGEATIQPARRQPPLAAAFPCDAASHRSDSFESAIQSHRAQTSEILAAILESELEPAMQSLRKAQDQVKSAEMKAESLKTKLANVEAKLEARRQQEIERSRRCWWQRLGIRRQ